MEELHGVLENINTDSTDSHSMRMKSCEVDLDGSEEHGINILQIHLGSFNIRIDPVAGDGDCVFRSIITQIRKTKEWREQNEVFLNHLTGLGLGRNVDQEMFSFRQTFVDNVQSEYYQMLTGIPKEELNIESERFSNEGTFSGDMGDLIMKVCSDFLQIPIIIISSLVGNRFVPFIPEETVQKK